MIGFKVHKKLRLILSKLFLALSAISIVVGFIFIPLALPFYMLHGLGVYLHEQSELLKKGGAE